MTRVVTVVGSARPSHTSSDVALDHRYGPLRFRLRATTIRQPIATKRQVVVRTVVSRAVSCEIAKPTRAARMHPNPSEAVDMQTASTTCVALCIDLCCFVATGRTGSVDEQIYEEAPAKSTPSRRRGSAMWRAPRKRPHGHRQSYAVPIARSIRNTGAQVVR